MAGTKLNLWKNVGHADIDNIGRNLIQIERGYNGLTLTHMLDSTVPAIAAGSVIEINGSLVCFDSEEAITYSSGSNLFVAIDGVNRTAFFADADDTSAMPTWSESRKGWYNGNYRYLPVFIIKSSSDYLCKMSFDRKMSHDGVTRRDTNNTDLLLITGMTSASEVFTNIDYPAGFTKNNTIIRSLQVYSPNNYLVDGGWVGYGPDQYETGTQISCILDDDYMILNLGPSNSYSQNQPYKILLQRIE